jgi:hypothetical protein
MQIQALKLTAQVGKLRYGTDLLASDNLQLVAYSNKCFDIGFSYCNIQESEKFAQFMAECSERSVFLCVSERN